MSRNSRGLWSFLLLTFGFFWGYILLAIQLDLSLDNPLYQLPMGFTPAIAAVIVRGWITREGFADAGLGPRFRAAWRWYLLAWVTPIGVLASLVVLATVFTDYRPTGLLDVLPLVFVALIVPPIFWGEEFGWRSYLQQRLSERPAVAILGTGAIWAVWHWPLAFSGYIEYDNLAVGLGSWSLHTISMGIVLAWLFVKSGSVWVTSLAHGCSNMVTGVGGEMLLGENGGLSQVTRDVIGVIPLLVLAGVVVAIGGLRRARLHEAPAAGPAPLSRAALT
ncbi:CPBP family intramembrane glutamic endopeptidase [Cryptosporangium minutisporangium]|uniref:Type II CAAX endopeptidase family protein n=1 Tax=Cryptosporangium minutisporangium TaxID=113569 RepID=A0ABP6SYG4_9ACTN